jgi:hypothetical protein
MRFISETSARMSPSGSTRTFNVAVASDGITLLRIPPLTIVRETPVRNTALCSGSRLNTSAALSMVDWSRAAAIVSIAWRIDGSSSTFDSRAKYSRVVAFMRTGGFDSWTRASARDNAAIALSGNGTDP